MRMALLHRVLLYALAFSSASRPSNKKKHRSVLMIAVDDLRTQLSVYPEGAKMSTPNIERIAAKSVVFERAYVQVALCMPSRTSLLTSRRPDTSRSWTIEADQVSEFLWSVTVFSSFAVRQLLYIPHQSIFN
jgi:hypothetical protein